MAARNEATASGQQLRDTFNLSAGVNSGTLGIFRMNDLMHCPNCEATMNHGDPCPECDHTERGGCSCQYCEPEGCYGPCDSTMQWCHNCHLETKHIKVSPDAVECLGCGELFNAS
jgi:hypothetical protein